MSAVSSESVWLVWVKYNIEDEEYDLKDIWNSEQAAKKDLEEVLNILYPDSWEWDDKISSRAYTQDFFGDDFRCGYVQSWRVKWAKKR